MQPVKDIGIKLTTSVEQSIRAYDILLQKIGQTNTGLVKTQQVLGKTSKETKVLGDTTKKTADQGKTLQKAFNLGAALMILRRVTNVTRRATAEMSSYIENYNLYLVSMRDYQDEALRFQNKLNSSWGTNISQTMRYQGFFMNLVSSLGIAEDFAYRMSESLTLMTFDMASLFNWTTDVAYQRLQAGIVGQTKPLRYAGVDVTQQTIQPILQDLGIDKQVIQLTQAEKVLLRYIAVLRQTTNAQGDYARTVDSTANQLKIMTQLSSEAYRWFGALFIGIIQKALPYWNAFLMVLKEVFKTLATMLGVSATDFDFFTGNVTNSFDMLGDDIEGVEEKLKSLRGSLRKFDEINNITSPTSGSDLLGGLGSTLILQQELDKMMKQYENSMKQIEYSAYAIRDRWMEILGFSKQFNAETGEYTFKWEKLTPAAAGFLGILGLIGIKLASWVAKPFAWLLGLGKATAVTDTVAKTGLLTKSFAFLGAKLGALGTFLTGLTGGLAVFSGALAVVGVGYAAYRGIKYLTEDAIQLDDVLKGVSNTTKDKLNPLLKEFDTIALDIVRLELGNNILSEQEAITLSNRFSFLSESLVNELDADKNTALKMLEPLRYAMSEEKFNDILRSTTSFYDDFIKITNDREKRALEIVELLSDKTVENKEDLRKELKEINEQMRVDIVKTMSDTSAESMIILGRLKDRSVDLSKKQRLEIVSEAIKTRNETIDAAHEQYHGILGLAETLYEAGAINEEEYSNMVNGARNTRDSTIRAAEEQYQGIFNEAKKGFEDIDKYINQDSGRIKSRIEVWSANALQGMKTFGDGVKDIFDKSLSSVSRGFNNFFNWLADKLGIARKDIAGLEGDTRGAKVTTTTGASFSFMAGGGVVPTGQMFVAREAGAELVGNIGNKTAVMNNDQIVASVSQGVARAISGIMGGSGNQPTTVILQLNDMELGRANIESINKVQQALGLSIQGV